MEQGYRASAEASAGQEPAAPGEGSGAQWVTATLTGRCGDTMKIELKIENDRVVEARFWGDGCFHSKACGQLAAHEAVGKHVDELPDISPEYIAGRLPGLPVEEDHCARLAHETLMQAVHNYFSAWNKSRKGG